MAFWTPAGAEVRAFTGAMIVPVAGEPMEAGVLVIQDGRILRVGADARIPRGAEVIDVSGKVIVPGLVDTHSHSWRVCRGRSIRADTTGGPGT